MKFKIDFIQRSIDEHYADFLRRVESVMDLYEESERQIVSCTMSDNKFQNEMFCIVYKEPK